MESPQIESFKRALMQHNVLTTLVVVVSCIAITKLNVIIVSMLLFVLVILSGYLTCCYFLYPIAIKWYIG